MSTPVPQPIAHRSSIFTDAHVPDPDDISKVNIRKRIEHDLLHLVEDVQILRDTTLSTRLSENIRSRVQRDYQGSMVDIRTLAEEESTRQSHSEISEHKWILNVVNSILLDVVRQQPWVLDNILKPDEERAPFASPNASQNDGGILSTNPQQLVLSGQGFDGRSEDGYRGAGAAHKGGQPEGSRGTTEAGEGDTKPRQPYSNVSFTQPLHSESQISRENSPLYRRHTPTSQPAEEDDNEEKDDSQPYSQIPRGPSPSSQVHILRSIPITPAHPGSANSTGSPRRSASLRHASPLDPDQYRGSNFTHPDTEHLPVHNHYLTVSNIALHSRQDTVPLPFPHDVRHGNVIPHRRINLGPWETPWGSFHSHPFPDDFEIHRCLTDKGDPRLPPILSDAPNSTHGQLNDELLGARHTEAFAKMHEAAAQKKVAEAKRKEAEAKGRETEAHGKVEEARRRELEARQKEELAKRNEKAARKREEEAQRKEEDARRWEDDARRRLEYAQKQELLARQREEACRFEEKVQKEEEAREEEAARRMKEKDGLRSATKEEERKLRPTQERSTRHAPGSSRHERNEVVREADDTAQLEATKTDTVNRSASVENAVPQQSNGQVPTQTKWQRDGALEKQRRMQLEEQHRLREQQYLEEKRREEERYKREREEQIRLDEELSRQEQARLDHEDQERKREEQIRLDEELDREEKEREAYRPREDQRRLAEEERYRILKEQHRKVDEQNQQHGQGPQQQHWQQKEILKQRFKDEQKEFGRKVVEHYRRTTERERRNNTGAAFGRSAPHRLPGPASAPTGNRAGVLSKPNPILPNTSQREPMPYTSAPEPEEDEWIKVGGTKKGVSLVGSKLEEGRALRTEVRAKQQQEQPEQEQPERLESERRAKNLNAKFVPEKKSTDGARATGRSGNTRTNLGGIRGLFQLRR